MEKTLWHSLSLKKVLNKLKTDKKGYIKYRLCILCKKNYLWRIEHEQFKNGNKRHSRLLWSKMKSNSFCKECGFKGHSCQLDIDHIDGNPKNNKKTNLQVLCANCHRLKTFKQIYM